MKRKPFKKAIPVFMVIFFVLAGSAGFFSSGTIAKENREIGRNDVQGKVLSIQTHLLGRGIIEVKSAQTEKVYIFYLRLDTVYEPYRYPAIGETIKVYYFDDRGRLQAMLVEIIQSQK